ncbi:MAG TPA: MarR family winged helix-turn-helix transcriptional regulator [Pseudonocardiaceae bacterium]|jgi:DNA-binding MarR family transcriptional regulator|nr:MarR family winged helix-turn-helix transcriptional regulator [Pseudonocardiaceae bacterium]
MTDPTAVAAVRALARASRIMERLSGDLNSAQYRVLSSIASGDERASRIAARLALGKPTISATVDSLVQRGLLTRNGEAADQRVAVLRLTDAGWALLDGVEAEMIGRLTDLQARTPGGEHLMPSLIWLGRAIDELHAERQADGRPVAR